MLFNSLTYLLFLLIVACIQYIVPGRFQWLWLLICSVFFYYTLLPVYLILFFALIIMNFYLGIAIDRSDNKRKSIFILSIFVNLFVLAVFKYSGFLKSLFSEIKGLSNNDTLVKIILPIGLSFFIFTILSYLIEVKRGTVKAERHIGIFASSLLFFPKIMQGPIEKPGKIFPQFKQEKVFDYSMIAEGVKLMLWGFFKKLVVADRLAVYVNSVYDNNEHHNGTSLLIATILYSFQIYTDFSGYTDIALGSAKILGFNLTNNFNRPYFSASIKEFWDRWHITLSHWLRDYIFLPIAVSLTGKMKHSKYIGIAVEKWIFMFASLITFVICGIWHGEGYNFLIWGFLFGMYLTVANWTLKINKNLRKRFKISQKSNFHRFYNIILTFLLVSFSWIFFRAGNVQNAFIIIKKIFSFSGPMFFDYPTFFYGSIAVMLLLFIEFIKEKNGSGYLPFKTDHWMKEQLAYAGLAALIVLIGVFDGGQFIYFQF